MTGILKGIWQSIEVYEPSTIFEAKDGAVCGARGGGNHGILNVEKK